MNSICCNRVLQERKTKPAIKCRFRLVDEIIPYNDSIDARTLKITKAEGILRNNEVPNKYEPLLQAARNAQTCNNIPASSRKRAARAYHIILTLVTNSDAMVAWLKNMSVALSRAKKFLRREK